MYLLVFDIANIIYSLTKQATLMRRSTVLSLPLQLLFPALVHAAIWWQGSVVISNALVRSPSTVVEHSPHHSKVASSNLAPGEKWQKTFKYTCKIFIELAHELFIEMSEGNVRADAIKLFWTNRLECLSLSNLYSLV